MGYDCTAMAVIGVMLTEDQLSVKKVERGCKCKNDPGEDVKFCPNCGKSSRVTVSEMRWEHDDGDIVPGISLRNCGSESEEFVMGFIVEDDDDDIAEVPDVDEVKEKLRKLLEPIGLWDEDGFGFFAVLHESC